MSLVGAVLFIFLFGWLVERDFSKLEAEIRAKGEPATLAELDEYYPQVDDEENGALVYMEAFKLLSDLEDAGACDGEDLTLMTSLLGDDYTLETLAQAHVYLDERESVFTVAAGALDYTTFRYPVDLSVYDGTGGRAFPHSGLRNFERLLCLQGVVAVHEKDWDSFSHSQFQMLHMANSLSGIPGTVAVIRVGILRRALQVMRRAIVTDETPPSVLKELAVGYTSIDFANCFRDLIIGARVRERRFLEHYYRGELELKDFMEPIVPTYARCYRNLRFCPGVPSLGRRHILQRMQHYTEILSEHNMSWPERYAKAAQRQPFVQKGGHMTGTPLHPNLPWKEDVINHIAGRLTRLDSDFWWERRTYLPDRTFSYAPLSSRDLLTLLAYPDSHPPPHYIGFPPFDLEDYTDDFIGFEARLRCVRLAMLIEIYRQERGVLPKTLDALDVDLVAAVGGDPFTGTPLGYRVVEGGFTLYSVGEDLVDDGGDTGGGETRDLVMVFVEDTRVIPEKDPAVIRDVKEESSGGRRKSRAIK